MRPSPTDWNALQGAIAGEVIRPDSPAYEHARMPAVAHPDASRPLAVVACRTPADVAETISLARRRELVAVPRSGGHCFAGRSSTCGIVIDVGPMRAVSVSGDAAMVGAGARLGDVYGSLAEDGLTVPAGCGPTVGIAGLTLGGGFGILGRRYGVTADSLVAAQVVLADGRVVECDDDRDAALFWALRGAGGGNFGVVTSLTLRTVPAPLATSYHLSWPAAEAAGLIDAWQAWAQAGPDELAASLLVVAGDDPARRPVVNLFGALAGSESDTTELLGAFVDRVGADPVSTVIRHASYVETKRHLNELSTRMTATSAPSTSPRHGISKSEFFAKPLPMEAITALVENLDRHRVRGEVRELDFSPWGGAYTRVPTHATAFAHRDALFLLKHTVTVAGETPPAERHLAGRWLTKSWESVHPWGTGGVYPNFPDPDLSAWERAYHGTNYPRLQRVKAAYDPDSFFRFHQAIRPRTGGTNTID